MPIKTDIQLSNSKSNNKKVNKVTTSNIMEDAPLFAGLDDYNLKQAERMDAVSTTAGRVKKEKEKKKETVTGQTKQTAVKISLPKSAPKVQKSQSIETGSMLLSVTEICALLKISRATLVRMDKSGQLPGRIKLGGSVRFHRETVETWLQSLINIPPAL